MLSPSETTPEESAMPRRRKSKAAVPFSAADVANVAKSNPYIARLIEDPKLRDNVREAIDSSKRVYDRVSSGKTSSPMQLLEDKKVQSDVRKALEAMRDATIILTKAPKARARKGITFGRTMFVAGVGGAAALAGSEKLRSKVLDVLFGAEEEFEYTPPAATPTATTPPPTEQAPAGAA
jgi:hypothetical protein